MGEQCNMAKDMLNSKEKVPLSSVWEKLRTSAEIDDYSIFIMSSFSPAIIDSGVESLKNLQDQFSGVEMAGIKAAYLPKNPNMWSYFFSELMGRLTYRERDLDALILDDSNFAKLHRAAYFLEQGHLRKSVKEIKKIQDEVVLLTCRNWLIEAENRLKFESCIEFLKTRALIMSSLAETDVASN